MAAFIDLTRASAPTNKVSQPLKEVSSSSLSFQGSKSCHDLLFQQDRRGVTDDDKRLDPSTDANCGVYPFCMPGFAAMPRRILIEPSRLRNKLSPSEHAPTVDKAKMLNKMPQSSQAQSIFPATVSSRGPKVPLSRLDLSTTSPPPKRRRVCPCSPSMMGQRINLPTTPYSEAEFEDPEKEDNVIDLTISDNFPTWKNNKASAKRGTMDLSEHSDGSESNGKAVKCTLHSRGIQPVIYTREVEVSRRLAAPGIRRRIAALGLGTKIDAQGIIDLSADSENDAEDEQNAESTQPPLCHSGVIGPEDYLEDDEISKLLANLDLGPTQRAFTTLASIPTRTQIEEFSQGNYRYKAEKTAALKDGNFLRITSIFKDQEGEVLLSGHLLVRQSSWGRAMPKRKNELVWVLEVKNSNFEASFKPNPTEVRLIDAVGIRNVTFTNQQYPEMSLKTYNDGGFRNARDELSNGPLFCRWKSIRSVGERKQKFEDCLVHLSYEEADPKPKARIRPEVVRDIWRGSRTALGGSHFTTRNSSINLASPGLETPSEQIQQYTFGDAFCGAGGCSSGASQAGLRVNWGFDKDKDAISVYAANLGRRDGAESLNEAVDEFCGRSDINRFMVDLLHMSPPCQPFSAAHTIPSEMQDEINQAALLSVGHLLEKIKPRVATIEETEGLINRHVEWFNALINIFITLGYSVRWKVIRCQDYGVPQQRKRLFIIAAG
jgi:DNA (cytosine-5)-methyltransferase 1